MKSNSEDEYRANIEAFLENRERPLDPDGIIILATNFLMCRSPEGLLFRLREERPPEDIISLYTYLKPVENTRKNIFEENAFSTERDTYKLQTLIGLLENAPIIKQINRMPLSRDQMLNRVERLELVYNTSKALDESSFIAYIQEIFRNNPSLFSLKTYYVVSFLTNTALSVFQRNEYRLLREIQQALLNWRKQLLTKDETMDEML